MLDHDIHRAHYSHVLLETPTGSVIALEDGCSSGAPSKTITNDAERVCQEAYELYGNHPITYRDSLGQWDQLKHDHGVFQGFRLLRASHRDAAVSMVVGNVVPLFG
jgi:hypothetical protein